MNLFKRFISWLEDLLFIREEQKPIKPVIFSKPADQDQELYCPVTKDLLTLIQYILVLVAHLII